MTWNEKYRLLMIALDISATEKGIVACNHTFRNSIARKPENLLFGASGLYYLSDGGYSRVGYDDFTGRLFLTSGSTDKVKCNWNRLGHLRHTIELFMEQVAAAIEKGVYNGENTYETT